MELAKVIVLILGLVGISDIVSFIRKKTVVNILELASDHFIAVVVVVIAAAIYVPISSYHSFSNYVPDGVYGYEVVISSGNRQYVLPAEVIKTTNEYDVDNGYDYWGNPRTEYGNENIYSVKKVFWPNGGYLYFGDDNYGQAMGSTSDYEDQDFRTWNVTITDHPVQHEKINQHHERKNAWPIIEWVVLSIGTVFEVILLLRSCAIAKRWKK